MVEPNIEQYYEYVNSITKRLEGYINAGDYESALATSQEILNNNLPCKITLTNINPSQCEINIFDTISISRNPGKALVADEDTKTTFFNEEVYTVLRNKFSVPERNARFAATDVEDLDEAKEKLKTYKP